MNSRYFCAFLIVLGLGCRSENDTLFERQSSAKTGVTFQNLLVSDSTLNILNYLYFYNGAGLAIADFNNDGLEDLYLVGNQVADEIYLNETNFHFKNVTSQAGIENEGGWSTSVSVVDINADGWLDIYVNKIGNYRSLSGRNLLYVNQGVGNDGVPTFLEKADSYGLGLVGFCTQSSFFDFDLDGDLDLFQLNHSVHPNRSYGNGRLRTLYDSLAGDRFLENIGGFYIDRSKEVGIYQGRIGYGLGISVGDLNHDGYPDLYVGNDFFENDYLYLNNQGKEFVELNSQDQFALGHTTHFSMGNMIADINGDGRNDILSLDMLPKDLFTYKSSGVEFAYPIYQSYLKNGYRPQYMGNTLHLNNGSGAFAEIGALTGIAASEWSWSVLVADFDMDTRKDIHITNGIPRATNDMDFINFVADPEIQKSIEAGDFETYQTFIDEMPVKKVVDFSFSQERELIFQHTSREWFDGKENFGAGSSYADFDNDGDLDLVINNTEGAPFVYENKAQTGSRNYLRVRFEGGKGNRFGIGATLLLVDSTQHAYIENYPNNGYLSSLPVIHTIPVLTDTIDALTATWPGLKVQELTDVASNQLIVLRESDAFQKKEFNPTASIDGIELDFKHLEHTSLEFEREPLIPFAKGYEGPKISIADVNNDGRDDFYISGAKTQSGALATQNQKLTFDFNVLEEGRDKVKEIVDQLFLDVDLDGDQDLFLVAGGNEFKNGDPLVPLLFINEEGSLNKSDQDFSAIKVNASTVSRLDYNRDGYPDILVTSNSRPGAFGRHGGHHLLCNMKGSYKDVSTTVAPALNDLGPIEEVVIMDLDRDGDDDMIIAGYWFPLTVFMNDNGTFGSPKYISESAGLWNSLAVSDFDQDGDLDILAGNWGLNSKLSASQTEPLRVYLKDFDQNGSVDPIVTYYHDHQETILVSKDELAKQIPKINKKYLSYKDFATASVYDLFGTNELGEAEVLEVTELATCYFEKIRDGWRKKQLMLEAQVSSIHAQLVYDFNKDGYDDVLLAGNTFELNTQLGRLDASHGLVLLNDRAGFFRVAEDQPYRLDGAVRDIKQITVGAEPYMLVARNNQTPLLIKLP